MELWANFYLLTTELSQTKRKWCQVFHKFTINDGDVKFNTLKRLSEQDAEDCSYLKNIK